LEDETERVKGENAKKDLELGKQKEEIEMLRNEINLLKGNYNKIKWNKIKWNKIK